MNYLDPSEYETYGLEEGTLDSWVTASSALIDAHCRRPTLGLAQYTERVRLNGQAAVHLTYLPLSTPDGAVSALVFGLAGTWTTIAVESLDWDGDTGEVTLPVHPLALPYNDIEITYMAGLAPVPGAVKCACAQIVRNAQATPALHVKTSRLDKLWMQYFADSLLDSGVQKLLAPYVAQKVG